MRYLKAVFKLLEKHQLIVRSIGCPRNGNFAIFPAATQFYSWYFWNSFIYSLLNISQNQLPTYSNWLGIIYMVKYCEIFEMEFEMVFIEPLRRTEQNKLRIFLDLGDLYTNAIPCSRRYVREFSMTHYMGSGWDITWDRGETIHFSGE